MIFLRGTDTADASCSLADKKNGFPIALPIALGTNWPEFTPADSPVFILACSRRPDQSQVQAAADP